MWGPGEYPLGTSRAAAQSLPKASCFGRFLLFFPYLTKGLLKVVSPAGLPWGKGRISRWLTWPGYSGPSLGTVLSLLALVGHPTPSTKARVPQITKLFPKRHSPSHDACCKS